jgi:hypothetical protein
MTRAVDHATGRRFDPFTDQSTVIAIKGITVAPMPMTPTVIRIAYPDANAARTGAKIDLCASWNRCSKRQRSGCYQEELLHGDILLLGIRNNVQRQRYFRFKFWKYLELTQVSRALVVLKSGLKCEP